MAALVAPCQDAAKNRKTHRHRHHLHHHHHHHHHHHDHHGIPEVSWRSLGGLRVVSWNLPETIPWRSRVVVVVVPAGPKR